MAGITRSQRLIVAEGLGAMGRAASDWQDEFGDEALAALGLELVKEACKIARQAVQCDEVADLRGLDENLHWLRESAREKRARLREMRAAVNVQRASVPESAR